MTRIVELLEQAEAAGRAAKVESARRGEPMMAPTLLVYRGDQQVAIVIAGTEGGGDVVRAARMCITGFAADVLVVAMDTFSATTLDNPITGKPWERGDMQLVADKHHGIERGWVTDAVHVIAINRAVDVAARTVPYRKVSRHRIEWGDPAGPDVGDDMVNTEGRIPDNLREAMNEPSLMLQMQRAGAGGDAFGLDAERALAHADLAVATVLHSIGCIVAFNAPPGSVRDEVMKASKNIHPLDRESC